MNNNIENKLQKSIDSLSDGIKTKGVAFQIYSPKSEFSWSGTSGNLKLDDKFAIASVSKLYTTAVLIRLFQDKKIDLDSSIKEYLPDELTDRILIYKNKDYSQKITVRHLLSHQSGLPDYFTEKVIQHNGKKISVEQMIRNNQDFKYDIFDVIGWAKELPARFVPGTQGRAYYSDVNFQLLSEIIKNVTSEPLSDVFYNYIFSPLGLEDTYLQTSFNESKFSPIFYNNIEIKLPSVLASEGGTGGIISNLNDSMRFITAFFNGELFDKDYFSQMLNWNKIFYPMEYGLGIMRWKPPFFMPQIKDYQIIGHVGASGYFSFYSPKLDAYFVGTTNDMNPAKGIKAIIKMINLLDKR